MSRKDRPKQLLRFIARPGDEAPCSLLELAARRLDGLIDPKHRFICTGESYRAQIREALPDFSDEQILGEPMARDTVNAVGFAAAVLEKLDKDAVFAVLTADHVIEPIKEFQARMDLGFSLVENDPRRFVTFSIKPTYPATGFGYVERGSPVRDRGEGIKAAVDGSKVNANYVARFVEKPDLPRAQAYVQSGDFGWNSGMFVWKASTFLEALKKYKPESHEGLMKIQAAWGTKKAKSVLAEIYPTLPKISVDYAVLEPASKDAPKDASKGSAGRFPICTVQMDLQWLDVGSWPSFAQTLPTDAQGNRSAGEGASLLTQARDTTIVNAQKGHTVAVLGVEDLIVVHTPDATLVMSRAKAEELKAVHAAVADALK